MPTLEQLKETRKILSDRSDRAGVAKCDAEIAEAEKLENNTKAVKKAAKKVTKKAPAKKAPAKKKAAKKKKKK